MKWGLNKYTVTVTLRFLQDLKTPEEIATLERPLQQGAACSALFNYDIPTLHMSPRQGESSRSAGVFEQGVGNRSGEGFEVGCHDLGGGGGGTAAGNGYAILNVKYSAGVADICMHLCLCLCFCLCSCLCVGRVCLRLCDTHMHAHTTHSCCICIYED
jgi:hypothetical protein